MIKMRAASSPLGIVGEPVDMAWAMLYLASDAARFVTGQVLRRKAALGCPNSVQVALSSWSLAGLTRRFASQSCLGASQPPRSDFLYHQQSGRYSFPSKGNRGARSPL